MKMLALEFSSPQRSVALVVAGAAGGPPATWEVAETAKGHAMKPLALVAEVLRLAGVEREQVAGIAVGLGPGSYTGIRAAIALAQGWQLVTGARLLGLSSAECVAAQATAEGIISKFTVVIDAQREEFYVADYEIDAVGMREVAPLRLATLAAMRGREGAGEQLVGPEVTRWFPGGQVIFPRAARLGEFALMRMDFVTGEQLEPIYLRETAFVKAPPTRVFPG